MKFFSFIIPALILFLSACSVNTEIPAEPDGKAPEGNEAEIQNELISFMKLLEFTRENYVDAEKVSYEKLFQGAMKGMLNHLDPYSNYETPRDFSLMMDDSRGSFAGIGATVRKTEQGAMEIVKVIPGKPADKAGAKAGDILLSADDFSFQDKSIDECVGKLRGEPGSSVILKIKRGNEPEKEIVVKRAVIQTPSITNQGIIQDKTGYIRINHFTSTTAKELDAFLKKYNKKMDRLIIDLRFNPGGQLEVTVEALSRFLEKGLLLVSVEGRSEGSVKYESEVCKKYTKLPVVVLINEHSASAAEIFSGCLKDYQRATVIGVKSFGKGSVQRVFPLPDGGGVRITIAKYYTPSRKVIHEKGIEPDITVRITEKQKREIAEQMMKNDTEPLTVKTGNYSDPQLEKALSVIREMKEFQMIR